MDSPLLHSPLLHTLLALPTVAYTGLLALAGLYWGLVIVGVADLDHSDGAAEALEGAVGAGKGAGEALTATATSGPLGQVFSAWRLRGVPLTVSLTLLGLGALPASALLLDLLGPLLPLPAAQVGAALGSLLAGGLTARLGAIPLSRVFQVRSGTRRASLLGQSATLSTGRVDAQFGQAEVHDGGAGLLLAVRYDAPNTLKKGDTVLLVHFDDARQAYVIEPLSPTPLSGAVGLRPTPSRELS